MSGFFDRRVKLRGLLTEKLREGATCHVETRSAAKTDAQCPIAARIHSSGPANCAAATSCGNSPTSRTCRESAGGGAGRPAAWLVAAPEGGNLQQRRPDSA